MGLRRHAAINDVLSKGRNFHWWNAVTGILGQATIAVSADAPPNLNGLAPEGGFFLAPTRSCLDPVASSLGSEALWGTKPPRSAYGGQGGGGGAPAFNSLGLEVSLLCHSTG